ncbi:hypothetical protein [Acaryochloris marina]|nr:hypothetical protein [Acaryochloris marina]
MITNATITNADPQQIWKKCHWLFFINIQGLILSLRRFERSLAANNLSQARVELETATDLMLASGSAMELAGCLSHQEYEHQVRPTMAPPHVTTPDFSGLMSWEHAALIEIWKKLRPTFANLPDSFSAQHQQFVSAYFSLSNAHRAVCQKFGGDQMGSLRCDHITAVQVLDKFTKNRWKLIDPKRKTAPGCPFR